MKYLTTIILENFQSHKYSVIEFKQGLNVIVGPSDTGKSAILRAIKWALYNEPAGDYFIREGEKECAVTLEFNDKTKIKRLRNRSHNVYVLYDNQGNETKFQGFGTSVPQEIIEEIGIQKIYLDSDESNAINLGEQLEGPFLLSERTSTRASAIGRLIGVNIIDDALRETLRDLRNSSALKKNIDENIDGLNTELKSYDYLEELSEQVDKIDKIKNLIKEKDVKLSILQKKLVELNKVQQELDGVNIYLGELQNLEKLDEMLKTISYLNKNYIYYNKKRADITKYATQINECVNILNRLNQVDGVESIYKDLIHLYNKSRQLINLREKLSLHMRELGRVKEIDNKLVGLKKIENNLILSEKKISRLEILTNLKKKLKDSQSNIEVGTIYTAKLESTDTVSDIYNQLENKFKGIYRLKELYINLLDVRKESDGEIKVIKKTDENISKELKRYNDLLNKIEVCPLCFSSIDNEKIQHIIEHYN